VRRVDLESNLLVADALVGSHAAVRLALDLFPDRLKVREDLPWAVQELAPLRGRAVAAVVRRRVRVMRAVRRVHEL
jgi:hypothetical protein